MAPMHRGMRVRPIPTCVKTGARVRPLPWASCHGSPGVAAASISHPTVVSADPANFMPHVVGSGTAVYALQQLGSTMYAGGEFSTVENAARTTTYSRSNIMAFDATTGAMASFAPSFNGAVWAIVSDGASMWVGGYFTNVNGVARRGVVKIDPTTGAVDPAFNAGFGSGRVTDLRLVNGRLIVGGVHPRPPRGPEPAQRGRTPATSASRSPAVSSQAGATDVYRFAVDPLGRRLVAIGNFTTVGAHARAGRSCWTWGPTPASLNPWYYQPLSRMCRADSLPAYLRGVDSRRTAAYFVLAATGYIPARRPASAPTCATRRRASRPTSPTRRGRPGSTTPAATRCTPWRVTGAAVYIEGHQRWANNPQGNNSAGPGAVPRSGIAALNPTTGLAAALESGQDPASAARSSSPRRRGRGSAATAARFSGEYRKGIAFVRRRAGPPLRKSRSKTPGKTAAAGRGLAQWSVRMARRDAAGCAGRRRVRIPAGAPDRLIPIYDELTPRTFRHLPRARDARAATVLAFSGRPTRRRHWGECRDV